MGQAGGSCIGCCRPVCGNTDLPIRQALSGVSSNTGKTPGKPRNVAILDRGMVADFCYFGLCPQIMLHLRARGIAGVTVSR